MSNVLFCFRYLIIERSVLARRLDVARWHVGNDIGRTGRFGVGLLEPPVAALPTPQNLACGMTRFSPPINRHSSPWMDQYVTGLPALHIGRRLARGLHCGRNQAALGNWYIERVALQARGRSSVLLQGCVTN
jgi:hypothetical protein